MQILGLTAVLRYSYRKRALQELTNITENIWS